MWVLVPPNSFVKEAAKYKKRNPNVKLIFDLIDLWPETMPISKFKSLPPFQYWKRLRDNYLNSADQIVTECNLYHEKLPRNINRSKVHTLYLARRKGKFNPNLKVPEDKIALCYLGSINNIIDISVIVNIIEQIVQYKPVELHVIGDGEKRDIFIKNCENAGAIVIYHGKVYEEDEKQKIFDSCHYGLNIMKDSVFVGLTMKSMDYFEAGLPIINNIHGDTWDYIEKYGIGINYRGNIINDLKLGNDYERDKVRTFFEENLSTESFEKKMKSII